jgi:regulator of protease activity HflC (stomatin/prohibitin superfamily)
VFDKIWEILGAVFEWLVPFIVLYPFEKGVLVRLGTFKRELEPGFHWVFPFHIDQVFHEHITARTEHLTGLATTTKDGHAVGFDAVVTWRINNIKRALLEVTDLKDAIADTCAGQIGTTLADATWEAIRTGAVIENLSDVVRKRGWKWGVEILNVQLSGIALVKNYRVTGQSQPHTVHLTPSGL